MPLLTQNKCNITHTSLPLAGTLLQNEFVITFKEIVFQFKIVLAHLYYNFMC